MASENNQCLIGSVLTAVCLLTQVDIDIKLRSCKGSCERYSEYQVDQESYVALDKQVCREADRPPRPHHRPVPYHRTPITKRCLIHPHLPSSPWLSGKPAGLSEGSEHRDDWCFVCDEEQATERCRGAGHLQVWGHTAIGGTTDPGHVP